MAVTLAELVAPGGVLGPLFRARLFGTPSIARRVMLSALRGADTATRVSTEVATLRDVMHRRLVPLCAVSFPRSETDGDSMLLVTEALPGGSAADWLALLRPFDAPGGASGIVAGAPARLRLRLLIILHASEALVYLHARGLCHGRLSLRNVLLASRPEPLAPDTLIAKLSDHALTGLRTALRPLAPDSSADSPAAAAAADMLALAIAAAELCGADTAAAAASAAAGVSGHLSASVVGELGARLQAGLPAVVAQLLVRCLTAAAAARPRAEEVYGALQAEVGVKE
jgi:serine/threonine protein kinase